VIRDCETLELLLESVRRFVRERLIPNEHQRDDPRSFRVIPRSQ